MRLSQTFGRTLRDAPADVTVTGRQLMLRAGLGRMEPSQSWAYTPLGSQVFNRLNAIWVEELQGLGGLEIRLPAEHYLEEAIASLCIGEIESYKDLPRILFEHSGPVKQAMALARDKEELSHMDRSFIQRCEALFSRMEIDLHILETLYGFDIVYPHERGQSQFVRCVTCNYAAAIEAGRFTRSKFHYGAAEPLEKVATPECKTIAELCIYLNIPEERTLKAVFYTLPDDEIVLVMLRGDLDVSEAKLKAVLGVESLEAAAETQIEAVGAAAGYASPIGLTVQKKDGMDGVKVIADESLLEMTNCVTGANEAGYHMIKANYPRDFAVTMTGDIAIPQHGVICAECGGTLHVHQGFWIGDLRQHGARYSQPVGATYLDASGRSQMIQMGSHRLSVPALMEALIDAHHDENGIIWPREVAPFDVHLVALAKKDEEAGRVADELYDALARENVEVLFDDRGLSPGVMFADADLIGIPLRVTVSKRSLGNGGVEAKWRNEAQATIVPLEVATAQISQMVGR